MKIVLALILFVTTAYAKVVDRIVVVVNNDVITLYDLDRAMAPRLSQMRHTETPGLALPALRQQVLEDLINQKLLDQEIAKADIEVTDEDLARAIAGVLQQNKINIEILRAELAAKGIAFEDYKEQLKKQVQQVKFMQQNLGSKVQVSSQDVQKYRQSLISQNDSNATVHLAWVFLPLKANSSNKEVTDVVRKARKITDRARRGGDFAKLAQDYSKDPAAKQGGDLGEKLLSELPPLVAHSVRAMEEGSTSDPVVTPQGVYVVKLIKKSFTSANVEEIQNEDHLRQTIYSDLMEQELKDYVSRLRRKAYIDIRE